MDGLKGGVKNVSSGVEKDTFKGFFAEMSPLEKNCEWVFVITIESF